jgi:hypothetical protein
MIKTKISAYKQYIPSDKELENLEKGKLEDFISFLRRKYKKFEVEKILEENNIYFNDLSLVIEKTINKLFFKMQKNLIKYAKILNPNYYFILKYFLAYLKLEDLKLIIMYSFSKNKLSEEDKKILTAHLISDRLQRYLSREELEEFLANYNFKEKKNDEIELINEFSKYLLKKLKTLSNSKVIDLIIANYNYNLHQKEKLLKISLKDYYLGSKKINNNEFNKKIKSLINRGNSLDSLLAFLLFLNNEKKKLLQILHKKEEH